MEDINNNNSVGENSQINLDRDLKYIKGEIISKQVDGKYMKYSKILKATSVIGLTKEQYLNYWKQKYKNTEYTDEIIQCCLDKFDTGLTDTQTMIRLIKNSKERPMEKIKALKLLKVDN